MTVTKKYFFAIVLPHEIANDPEKFMIAVIAHLEKTKNAAHKDVGMLNKSSAVLRNVEFKREGKYGVRLMFQWWIFYGEEKS